MVDLPLVGGHPAIDLINSLERGIPRPHMPNQDFLTGPKEVRIWGQRVGLVDDREDAAVADAWRDEQDTAEGQRTRLIHIREALHALCVAAIDQTEPDAVTDEARQLLHREWQQAVSQSNLRTDINRRGYRLHLGENAATLIADRAAQAGIDLMTGDQLDRLGRCPIEGGGCGWLYLDHTKNRSRRWCRMADCGNHVKANRLTERRRRARTTTRQDDVTAQ